MMTVHAFITSMSNKGNCLQHGLPKSKLIQLEVVQMHLPGNHKDITSERISMTSVKIIFTNCVPVLARNDLKITIEIESLCWNRPKKLDCLTH